MSSYKIIGFVSYNSKQLTMMGQKYLVIHHIFKPSIERLLENQIDNAGNVTKGNNTEIYRIHYYFP